MIDEGISKINYIFENQDITNCVNKAFIAFNQHDYYYVNFYYQLYKLKKLCEQTTIDEDLEAFDYLAQNQEGEIIERHKKFSYNSMVKHLFNVDRCQLSKGFNVLKRFSTFNPDSKSDYVELKSEFADFSDSKLQELLPYTDTYIADNLKSGKITASQTVKQIRAVLKNLPPKEEKQAPEEFCLDRKEEYTLDELRDYSRNDLLMIAYQSYQGYIRLKKKIKNSKKEGN